MSDYRKLSIHGYVTVKNGNRIIVDQQQNAIVRAGMRGLRALMSYGRFHTAGGNNGWGTFYGSSYTPTIRFGKNALTETTQLTDTLVSEIAVNPTSLTNNNGLISSGTGNVLTKFNANWASGVLNEQLSGEEVLGELGLFLGLADIFGTGTGDAYSVSYNQTLTLPVVMFSRFNLGDKAFVPTETAPVIVEWELRWEFV